MNIGWKKISGRQFVGGLARRLLISGLLCLGYISPIYAADRSEQQRYDISIPQLNAADALNQLAEQTGATFLFPYALAEARQANPVAGRYTLMQALTLLLKGSDLSSGLSDKGAIRIFLTELQDGNSDNEEKTMNTGSLTKKLSALLASVFAASGAVSQEQPKPAVTTLQEVIVTARKREESLQRVPISVTAFSAEDMAMQSMANLRDVARFAPNLVVSNTGGSPNQGAVFIRGVGEPEQFTTADPAVGIYVDGVYYGRAQGSIMDLLDLQRVEILRGPQGTLFGRNTIGGAINLVSVPPRQETQASFQATYGNHERIEVGGSINAPLIDEALFARVSAKHTERDCLAETVNRGACIGGIETDAVRASLRWLPTEDITVDLTGDYINDNGYLMPTSLLYADATELVPVLYNGLVSSGALGADAVPFTGTEPAAGNDPYVSASTVTTKAPLDVRGASLKVNWAVNDNLDLIAISAYREMEQSYAFDLDKTEADMQAIITEAESSQFSQELRLEGIAFEKRLEWIAGLYYFDEYSKYYERGFGGLNIIFGLPADLARSPKQDMTSIAAFGHFTYSLTDTLDLTGGLRYNRDEKDVHFRYTDLTLDAPGVFSLLDHKASESWSELSPKIGLDYHYSDDVLLYASVSSGYRNGGFNGRALSMAETEPYDPETLVSYELGIKSQLFDNKLRFNAAAYFSDYTDRQVLFFELDTDTGTNAQVIENAAAAEVTGFEMELTALVTERLTLEANAGYMDAEITESKAGSSITEDTYYPYAPEWTIALAADYLIPLDSGDLRFRVDYNYRDLVFFFPRVPAESAYTFQKGFGLWNARLAFSSAGERWNVALWGKNLSDEIYCLQCVSAPGLGFAVGDFSEGREYGLTVSYNFF